MADFMWQQDSDVKIFGHTDTAADNASTEVHIKRSPQPLASISKQIALRVVGTIARTSHCGNSIHKVALHAKLRSGLAKLQDIFGIDVLMWNEIE